MKKKKKKRGRTYICFLTRGERAQEGEEKGLLAPPSEKKVGRGGNLEEKKGGEILTVY